MSTEKLKLIVFVQALVIVAGLAFLLGYSMMERRMNNEVVVSDVQVSTSTAPATEPVVENLPVIETIIDNNTNDISGHNDAGMEYPIPDDESLLR